MALKYNISYCIEKKVVSLFIAQTHNLEREHERSNQQAISFGYLRCGRGVSGLNLLSNIVAAYEVAKNPNAPQGWGQKVLRLYR